MGKYLLFDVTGTEDTVEDVRELAKTLIHHVKEENCHRVLLDERNLVIEYDVHDFLTVAEDLASTVPTMGIRVATLFSENNKSYFQWIETAMQNRSMNYKIFTSKQDALEWLQA